MNFRTLARDGQVEEEIKKSRFICHVKRVETEEEARSFIAAIKKEHYKANHNCSAFILGEKSQIKRSSDDGEPSGTAGVPMLTVLEQQELTNVCMVVTRYFGGIKLGAGGLIRAYAGSVAQAIREIGLVQVKDLLGMEITLSYSHFQDLEVFLTSQGYSLYSSDFQADVVSMVYLDEADFELLAQLLIDHYHGQVLIEKKGSQTVELPLATSDH